MLASGGGAMLFTGATSSIRGKAGGLAFSSAKFAVRGLAESLARELWPKGIHVAHIIIYGWLATPTVLEQNPTPTNPCSTPTRWLIPIGPWHNKTARPGLLRWRCGLTTRSSLFKRSGQISTSR